MPATALTGTTRMRVVVNYTTGAVASCNTNITGETEDYSFAVTAPATPTITSLGSSSGCAGTSITINGTNFTGATAANVQIGGTPVSSITSNSGTQIVAVIGNGTTGNVTVTIGSNTATSSGSFTVQAQALHLRHQLMQVQILGIGKELRIMEQVQVAMPAVRIMLQLQELIISTHVQAMDAGVQHQVVWQ